jgi:hypothetical protein
VNLSHFAAAVPPGGFFLMSARDGAFYLGIATLQITGPSASSAVTSRRPAADVPFS